MVRDRGLEALELGRRQLQRACRDECCGLVDRPERALDSDATVLGGVGREPPRRLGELALAARPVAALRLVPGDGDVDEPLEEVALLAWRVTPLVLQLLVRVEVRAGADSFESSFQAHRGIIGVVERRW